MNQEKSNKDIEEKKADISSLSLDEQIKEISKIMKDSQIEVAKTFSLKKETNQKK